MRNHRVSVYGIYMYCLADATEEFLAFTFRKVQAERLCMILNSLADDTYYYGYRVYKE